MNHRIAECICLMILLALPGCAVANGGSTASTTRTFELAAVASQEAVSPTTVKPATRQLLVNEPTASRALDSENVVVKFANAEIGQLQNAAWSDRLPRLLQRRLVEALQSSRRFRAVSDGRDKIAADLVLSTEIQAFQIETAKPSDSARIDLRVKLVEVKTGHVVDTRNFTSSKTIVGKSETDNLNALNQAFVQAAAEAIAWVSAIETAKPSRKRRA